MLTKLLKYDFKATGRIMIPIYIASIIFAILNSLTNLVFSQNALNNILFSIPSFIISALLVCILVFSGFVSFIISLLHFRKNIFCAEGYLTNTLPIKSTQIINSKLITAVFFQIVTIIIAFAISFLMAITISKETISFANLLDGINLDRIQFQYIVMFIEIIITALISLVLLNMKIYCAISIGHSFNSYKIAASVGMYFVFVFIESTIQSMLTVVYTFAFSNLNITPVSMFALLILYLTLWTIGYYLLTNYFIKQKLNLE